MGRKKCRRWVPVLVALVLTVAAVAALSLISRAEAAPQIQVASAEARAELSAPALGRTGIPFFASLGGFLGILSVPTVGLAAILRPKKPKTDRRRAKRGAGARREYTRRTRV